MANRKRPDIAAFVRAVANVVAPLGRMISRRPSIAAGSVAFVVAFGFVTLNALQYQQVKHPSPFFDTRQPGFVRQQPKSEPAQLKTSVGIISRDPVSTSSIPADRNARGDTVQQLQEALIKRGLYNGAADGIPGPMTREAILKYQQRAGLPETGDVSDELLVHLLISDLDPVVRPRTRPADAGSPTQSDAVLEPRTGVTVPETPTEEVDSNLVIRIQRGLSNIAYSDVKVDGVVGQQTATAIRDFQMHYRLPVTGKPDRGVLEKLMEIGAL